MGYMNKFSIAWLGWLLLAILLAPQAEAQDFRVLINGSAYHLEVPMMGPMELTYDLGDCQADSMQLFVHQLPIQPQGSKYERCFDYSGATGRCKLSFRGLKAGFYVVKGRAQTPQGSVYSNNIVVRYGGMQADENYAKRRHELPVTAGQDAAFTHIGPLDAARPVALLSVKPQVTVVKPGETTTITASLQGGSELEEVQWVLVGVGKLEVQGRVAVYIAPPEGEHTVNVRCRHGQDECITTIFVTKVPLGTPADYEQ